MFIRAENSEPMALSTAALILQRDGTIGLLFILAASTKMAQSPSNGRLLVASLFFFRQF
jgi:hypothetical protein